MNNKNNLEWKNLKCPKCGKTNTGWQDHCLLCGADLIPSNISKDPIYKCPSCGATVHKGQKFCTSCGEKLPVNLQAIANNDAEVKKCPVCGAVLKPGANFCTQCGAKV